MAYLKDKGRINGHVEAVFCDTGWEHEETYKFVQYVNDTIYPVTTIRTDKYDGFPGLVEKRGFPSRIRKFCTQELKVFPFQTYIDKYPTSRVINVQGIRRDESAKRSSRQNLEVDPGGYLIWNPILNWTEQMVFDFIRDAGFEVNPLYAKGAKRVGCWPCIFSNKDEIYQVYKENHSNLDIIRRLEQKHSITKGIKVGMFYRNREVCQIDEVIEWSKTKYGGKELRDEEIEPEATICEGEGFCE